MRPGSFNVVTLVILALIVLKWAAQVWLEQLNLRHVRRHAGAAPEAFKGIMDEATYARSVEYTMAKGRLDYIELTYHAAVLLIALFSGMLPWGYKLFQHWLGGSAWAMAAFLFATGVALSLPDLPLDWYG